jgi:hypothetical protein
LRVIGCAVATIACFGPKGASWLNMIECEFSVIARQCLDRRIAPIGCLRSEVLALLQRLLLPLLKRFYRRSGRQMCYDCC